MEFVNYLEYIEAASGKVDEMENELEYCKELYDIMEEFQIFIPDIDMDNYLSVSVTLGSLRNLVDKKSEEKVLYIKKFNDQMNKDISFLIAEVGKVKDQCSVFCWFIYFLIKLIKRSPATLALRYQFVHGRSNSVSQRTIRTSARLPETSRRIQELPKTIQSNKESKTKRINLLESLYILVGSYTI